MRYFNKSFYFYFNPVINWHQHQANLLKAAIIKHFILNYRLLRCLDQNLNLKSIYLNVGSSSSVSLSGMSQSLRRTWQVPSLMTFCS